MAVYLWYCCGSVMMVVWMCVWCWLLLLKALIAEEAFAEVEGPPSTW